MSVREIVLARRMCSKADSGAALDAPRVTKVPTMLARAKTPEIAFAAVMTFLAQQEPFASTSVDKLVSTVSGAIKRGHYLIATTDGRVAGVLCWALVSSDVARRWAMGLHMPSYEEAGAGDTVFLTVGAATHASTVTQGLRHLATLYPGRPYRLRRWTRTRPTGGTLHRLWG